MFNEILIQVDRGTEFYNYMFQNMLSALGVQLYSTYSEKKASIVERVQRTIMKWNEMK